MHISLSRRQAADQALPGQAGCMRMCSILWSAPGAMHLHAAHLGNRSASRHPQPPKSGESALPALLWLQLCVQPDAPPRLSVQTCTQSAAAVHAGTCNGRPTTSQSLCRCLVTLSCNDEVGHASVWQSAYCCDRTAVRVRHAAWQMAGDKAGQCPAKPHLERVPLEDVSQHPTPRRLVQDAEVGEAALRVRVGVSILYCMWSSRQSPWCLLHI
jgi:hypothetical protein